MIDENTVSILRDRLVDEKKKGLVNGQKIDDSRRRLHQPEREAAESAKKTNISRVKEQQENTTLSKIKDIEAALAKISMGKFGDCEACGDPIRKKRLLAIPWTRYCIVCAENREVFSEDNLDEVPVSVGNNGLTDEEMVNAVWDELFSENRIDTEELEITCKNGVIMLDGYLPGRKEHSILLGIIHDILDFNEIIDNIRFDRQLWERRDRPPGLPSNRLSGSDKFQASFETNEPTSPPDVMVPEKPQ